MNRSSCHRPPVLSWRARQRGSIAIIVGLSLAVMVGFAGLALDLGRLYVNKTELQSAADACALAASRELACDTSAGGVCPAQFLLNAETAGIFAAAKNKKDMQGSAVTVAASDVKFNTVIGPNSGYLSRADGASVNSKFVMCSARSTGLVPWFMGAMDLDLGKSNTVISAAVATLAPSRNFCVGAPIGMCRKAGAGSPDYGYAVGEWIKSQFTSAGSDDVVSGDFKWVDFTPNAGGNTEIRDGLLGSDGVCNVKINDALDVVQQGQQQGAKSAYNTRFGIYPKGANAYTPADAPPDRTGYAYPNKSPGSPVIGMDVSAYADYRERQRFFTPFNGVEYDDADTAGGKLNTNNKYLLDSTQHQETGANRRLINVPAIDCGAATASILGMVCVLMLNPMADGANGKLFLEYRGASNSAASPCAAFGSPGGPGSNGPMVPTLVQ